MIDPHKLTSKVQAAIKAAISDAQEQGHAQWTAVHLAKALFDDPEGLAKSCTVKAVGEEGYRAVCRVLKRKVDKLPKVSGSGRARRPPAAHRKDLPVCSKFASKRAHALLLKPRFSQATHLVG